MILPSWWEGGLCYPEVREDVVGKCACQLLGSNFFEVGLFPVKSGVVDEDVDGAEFFDGLVDDAFECGCFERSPGMMMAFTEMLKVARCWASRSVGVFAEVGDGDASSSLANSS